MEALEQLGPYRLARRLGRGGMAEVYLGIAYGASGFEKRVAIKTLLPSFRGVGEYERALIEEARLGARLSHRNLVQTIELGVDQGTYFVVMEYVDGADLGSLVAGRALPSPLVWLIAEELALALEYLHEHKDDAGRRLGLVHRDLSPANVLVSRWGEVKLADFGIAKATLLAEDTRPSVRKGKFAYMSPEQAAGQALSPQSDQFSLGVTLVELLSGARPFDAESIAETLDRIRQAQRPALDLIDPRFRDLCWRCLERAPGSRFAGLGELRRAIAALRHELPPVTPPDLAEHLAIAAPG